MRDRHRFRPTSLVPLEKRQVPSGSTLITPAASSLLALRAAPKPNLSQQAAVQVNLAFNSFTNDYLQALGTYLKSTAGIPRGVDPALIASQATTAFSLYIKQRVQLLSQDLIRSITQLPGSQNPPSGAFGLGRGSLVVHAFLNRKIEGAGANTLLTVLTTSIPPASLVGTTGSSVALYTLDATTAIETARAVTLNNIRFLVNHTLKNGRTA